MSEVQGLQSSKVSVSWLTWNILLFPGFRSNGNIVFRFCFNFSLNAQTRLLAHFQANRCFLNLSVCTKHLVLFPWNCRETCQSTKNHSLCFLLISAGDTKASSAAPSHWWIIGVVAAVLLVALAGLLAYRKLRGKTAGSQTNTEKHLYFTENLKLHVTHVLNKPRLLVRFSSTDMKEFCSRIPLQFILKL